MKQITYQRGQKIDHIKDYESNGFIRTWSIHIPTETIDELKKTLDSNWINTGKKEKILDIYWYEINFN